MPANPDLSRYRRPLIFGGSFDPPHVAHLTLPAAVAEAIDADVVAYVPAARPPHKLDLKQTDATHRVAMLRLVLADRPDAVVLTDEIDRAADGRPSYTVETLEALRPRFAQDAVMRLLIGTDQVAIFDSWHRGDRIVELAEPVVMMRPPTCSDSLPGAWRGRVVEVPETDVSSTEVRRRLAAGKPTDGLLHPGVAAYIAEHGLYDAATAGR
ncbi:MAG: nicotinate (nicotinamide) nucleotide adenylyltransferase [Planctomycetota bacterium]